MSDRRGFPGEEGHPGKPGEEGKDAGEGGRGGEGGEGGAGGAGAPQGPGGGGGEGGLGGRGARGMTGPAGVRGLQGAQGVQGTQPKLRWAPAFGYVLLAVVLGFLLYQNHVRVNDARELAVSNQTLITRVEQLSRVQADQSYNECVARNQRARESVKAFQRLVDAHVRDGSVNAAAVWGEYLTQTRKLPLPACKKPA